MEFRKRTKHPLPKINNIVEIENYLNSTNPKIIKAKKLYIEYLKKFTGFEKIELVWNPCRKYKGKKQTVLLFKGQIIVSCKKFQKVI